MKATILDRVSEFSISGNVLMADAWALEKKRDFGLAVKRERRKLGLSQESLAERASLHRTYITDIERGARNISLETMCRLAVALQVSIESLLASEHRTPAFSTISVPVHAAPHAHSEPRPTAPANVPNPALSYRTSTRVSL